MLSLAAGGAAIAVAGSSHWCLPHLLRRARERSATEWCRSRRTLVLTYDDGPGAALTAALLDLLQGHAASATFFLLGRRVLPCTALVDRVLTDGHELACHGQEHLNAWKTWPWRATRDIALGYDSLSKWIPSDATFRPPYGKLTLATWWTVRRRGARIGWWTIDSGDTHATLPTPQSVADAAARAGGGVVLMHDFDRGLERANFVLRTTELLLEMARREGLRVCRYRDLWEPSAC